MYLFFVVARGCGCGLVVGSLLLWSLVCGVCSSVAGVVVVAADVPSVLGHFFQEQLFLRYKSWCRFCLTFPADSGSVCCRFPRCSGKLEQGIKLDPPLFL